jgi:DNA-binding CsgD family transcriptional regulator
LQARQARGILWRGGSSISLGVEARTGHPQHCREHAAEALDLARTLDTNSLEIYIAAILGLLELQLGNLHAAVQQLELCARLGSAAELGQPDVVPYEPDLVEALFAVGRADDARVAAELLEERAQRVRSPWGLATAARCRGLLAEGSESERAFHAALTLHERVPGAFDRARTELCYGERLRRTRRRTDAREHLSSALATFEQLKADPWAERARRELQATGATARPRTDPAALDRLTPQELRVVMVLAEGATVRDAAAQLFLSPKTIEAHLGRAYRKLGVRNRAELATRLAREQAVRGA